MYQAIHSALAPADGLSKAEPATNPPLNIPPFDKGGQGGFISCEL